MVFLEDIGPSKENYDRQLREGGHMQKLLYLFVLLFPYLIWPWGAAVDTSSARLDWLTLFTGIMWCGFLYKWVIERYRPRLMPANLCFLIFVALATLSTLFSDFFLLAWLGEVRRYEGLWAWYSYITFFQFFYLFFSGHNYRRLVNALMFGGFISSIYGVFQHFGLDPVPRAAYAVERSRSFAFFGNPNFYGAYLVMILTVGAALFLVAEKRKAKIWYVVSATAFAAMIYTETRGAWLGFAVSLIVFTWFYKKEITWKRYIALLLTFVCIFALILVEMGPDRLLSIGGEMVALIDGEEGALSGRGYIWKRALPLVKEYFWLGSGPDTFGEVFPQEGHIYHDKAHSEPLQIAITMGIPALVFYLLGLAMVFYRACVTARKVEQPQERVMLYGLLAACIGYQVHALVNISTIGVSPFFWALLGITYKLGVEGSREGPAVCG